MCFRKGVHPFTAARQRGSDWVYTIQPSGNNRKQLGKTRLNPTVEGFLS